MTSLLVTIDAEARDLIVEALRADSTRRQRAATRAAAELHAERAAGDRRDIRSGAVMVTNLLVDAARLDDAANAIAKAEPAVGYERQVVTWTAPPADELDLDDPAQVAAAVAEAAALPDPPARPVDADPGGASRSPAEALAETRNVIAELGLNITREDIEGDDDDVLDGRTDEDDPGPLDGVPAELADLAPQEA